MNPEILALLNHRLFHIFEGICHGKKEAFEEYFKLVLLEAVTLVLDYGWEPEDAERIARIALTQILGLLTPYTLAAVSTEGAFTWWRKRLRALLAPYFRDDGL